MLPPVETRYADTSGGKVAYQVVGSGPTDLVFFPDWLENIEVIWEEPRFERFLKELAAFRRLILFDKRGSGISDQVPHGVLNAGPTLELAAEDLRAVLDACDCKQADILAVGVGTWSTILFAATAPSRVRRLVLIDSAVGLRGFTEDRRAAERPAEMARFVERIISSHGSGELLRLLAPKAYSDEGFRRWWARYERLGMSPKYFGVFWRSAAEIDLSPVLPTVRAPTLVLSRTESRVYPVEHGRYVAEHIPGATFRELPGGDELVFMEQSRRIVEEAREFLTGVRDTTADDRILATILFTDIVNSTEQLATLGDRTWRDRLLRHHDLVRAAIERFRGREIETAGDGFLATFDGPARAIHCAMAIRDSVASLGIRVRAGIHTGECELVGDKIAGIAVHTAARVMHAAEPGEILVSRTVKDLVAGSGLAFEDRGLHELKGIPDRWQLLALVDAPRA
jgi:class 3 adenylate cyclase